MLGNTPNQSTKFRTKNWVETNDESRASCNPGSQIRYKNSMWRSSLCDYSDAYILVKGIIIVRNTGTQAVLNNRNKKVIFKNCTPFTDCLREINNTEIGHAKDIDEVMPMFNLIEYSDNCWKKIWKFIVMP